MLPPLSTVKRGLGRTTEALALELAGAGGATPDWSELEWRLAAAAAAAHGASPLLCRLSTWEQPAWRRFLETQREHVAQRHRHIAALLERMHAGALMAGVAMVPLKGSALHAIGLYQPGDRPMADIDLLVDEQDVAAAAQLLRDCGYVESFVHWKHRVFKPAAGAVPVGLGEHRDAPINIELHARIQERLPVSAVDITARILPRDGAPGLHAYPSNGALMSHLLLHAAGNLCGRSLRLIHLHDIALLAARMSERDWAVVRGEDGEATSWWALPPLRLVARYYPGAVPAAMLAALAPACPPWLRAAAARQTLTQMSCSALWLRALPGLEWSRSAAEAWRYLDRRIRPTDDMRQERADMARTQVWLQGESWVTQSHGSRVLAWLTRPVPRMDTLYVLRAAWEHFAPVA